MEYGPAIGCQESYRVFTRTWWVENPDYPHGLEPGAGCPTYIGESMTEGEARACAKAYNATHDPGRLSLKAEFESE